MFHIIILINVLSPYLCDIKYLPIAIPPLITTGESVVRSVKFLKVSLDTEGITVRLMIILMLCVRF